MHRLDQPQLDRQLRVDIVPKSHEDLGQTVFDVVAQLRNHFVGILVEEGVQRIAQNFVAVEQICEMDSHAAHVEGHFHFVDVDRFLKGKSFIWIGQQKRSRSVIQQYNVNFYMFAKYVKYFKLFMKFEWN